MRTGILNTTIGGGKIRNPSSTFEKTSIAFQHFPVKSRDSFGSNQGNIGDHSKQITLEELRKYFHLPIAEVAKQFGTCTTALKKICRKLKISKWPYRQILSLTKSIQSLEMAALNEGVASDLRIQYRQRITKLQKAIAEVMKDPSKAMESLNASLIGNGDDQNDSDGVEGTPGEESGGSNPITHSSSTQFLGSSSSVPTAPLEEKTGNDEDVQYLINAAAAHLVKSASVEALKKNKLLKRTGDSTDLDGQNKRGRPSLGDDVMGPPGIVRKSSSYDNAERESNGISSAAFGGLSSIISKDFPNSVVSLPQIQSQHQQQQVQILPSIDIGMTTVQCQYNQETNKFQFHGQVLLAPLHRKKFRPSSYRKVVPLMEPDIGSSFSIDFFPNLVTPK
jgi:hypothetical protein